MKMNRNSRFGFYYGLLVCLMLMLIGLMVPLVIMEHTKDPDATFTMFMLFGVPLWVMGVFGVYETFRSEKWRKENER